MIEPVHGKRTVLTLRNIQQICKDIAQFDEEHRRAKQRRTGMGKGSKITGVIVGRSQDWRDFGHGDKSQLRPEQLPGFKRSVHRCRGEHFPRLVSTERNFPHALADKWSNFCVSQDFEPGSTFKPVTVSSALESGGLDGR